MKKIEHKAAIGKLEIKFAANDTEDKTFSGYGAYFGNQDSYGDVISPGAFTKSIADFKGRNSAPAMLWNHDASAMPIGIWNDIEEDVRGLKVSGQFLDTTSGNDAYTIVKAGAVQGLSIGYVVTGFEVTKSGNTVSRLITEIKLFEISVVTFPANDQALISDVKSFDDDDDCDCDDPDRDPDDYDDDCDCDDEEELSALLVGKGFDREATSAFLKTRKSKKSDDESDDDDAEDDAETKYMNQAAMAVKQLCLKLKQESHG